MSLPTDVPSGLAAGPAVVPSDEPSAEPSAEPPADLGALLRQRTVMAGTAAAPDVTNVLGPGQPVLPLQLRSLQDGRYVVRRVLGRGGFGITFECVDTRLQRLVAVKALAPVDHRVDIVEAKQRFLREATVLARFTHPGIVRVYEVFEEGDVACLVMELLDGPTLADVVDGQAAPLTEADALDIGTRCADALAVVHHAGVLHRDLNPSNVVLTRRGRVVLIDFGLAREFVADTTGTMTRVVTPGYAPPEQYLAAARFGPPTDVYGLAATLYRLVTGRVPTAALDRQAGAALPAPMRLNPAVSRVVNDGLLDGLELRAAHRPQTMADLLSRLGSDVDVSGRTPLGPSPSVPTGPKGPHVAPVTSSARAPAPAAAAAHAAPVTGTVATVTSLIPPDLPDPEPYRSPGRWKVLVPAVVALGALGSVAPALVVPLLALMVLPALATAGDAAVFVRLRRRGTRLRWVHRMALPLFVPLRFVRNVATGLQAGVPALLVAGATVAVALLLDAGGGPSAGRDLALRLGGAAVALGLAVPVFADRVRFRAAVIGDLVLARCLDEGRIVGPGLVLWALAVVAAVVGLGFQPELWPLGP